MTKGQLILEAKKAQEKAYAPYSNFPVGAAILTKDDRLFHGANVENASYSLTCCAERNALFSAYSQGIKKEDILAMAVIGNTEHPISPCGACRQVMHELMPADAQVLLTNKVSDQLLELKVVDLLPHSFDSLK